MASVRITDNSSKVLSAITGARERALENIGLAGEGYAKKTCPVDTGRLRNSITHAVDGNDVYIGTNVEYAPPVEMGTVNQKAQPFLRPAATEHTSTYKSIIMDEYAPLR